MIISPGRYVKTWGYRRLNNSCLFSFGSCAGLAVIELLGACMPANAGMQSMSLPGNWISVFPRSKCGAVINARPHADLVAVQKVGYLSRWGQIDRSPPIHWRMKEIGYKIPVRVRTDEKRKTWHLSFVPMGQNYLRNLPMPAINCRPQIKCPSGAGKMGTF